MIFGMTLSTFTLWHVVISLLGIASGFVVMYGLLTGKRLDGVTAFFLATTVATSVTGFFFPFAGFGPAHIVGVISLVILAVAIPARYAFHLAGPWRSIYAIGAVAALYFNVFVGVVQAFRHVPALYAIAPEQTEPPFVLTQLIVAALFVFIGIKALKRFPAAQLLPR